ncbi:MAG: hypothetical protein NC930_03630 [Candidatus Omnitrophica bacterium]|nr:hypothetical protein [Candidatus Omnitrophota bacterium]
MANKKSFQKKMPRQKKARAGCKKRIASKKATAKTSKRSKRRAGKSKLTRSKKRSLKVKAQQSASAKVTAPLGELVGYVTHYFPHVRAGVVKIKKGEIRRGDLLYFKGHTTDFKQVVTSLQIDHKPIEMARSGAEIGIEVKDRVREGDVVYKTQS